jgi:Ras-related protein Rab-18
VALLRLSSLSFSLSHIYIYIYIYIYIGIRSKNDDRARDRAFRAMKVDDASLFQAYSHLIKILLVGDSGVGKTSVLSRFIDPEADLENVSTTIGVDFKLKYVTSKRTNETVKLTVWDTAGQERFRTLTSSYYRGAQGVVFVYDICSRESFDSIENVWQKEVDMYSTIPDAIKIVVGNKIDKEEERKVKKEDAIAFAKRNGCLFLECSAKTKVSVKEIFDELLQAIMETPSLLKDGPSSGRRGGGVNLSDARGDGNIVTRNCCS